MSDAAALMDRMYRRQRHIYDLSRKFYLLGRDEVILRLGAAPGDRVLEIGCGTGRNLIKLARVYPEARLFGLDISREMLATAATSMARARLSARVALARADATNFEPRELFGQARFERVMISYALSMIPRWREALAQALDVLSPRGALHLVDFGDCAGLPRPFRIGLRRWLAAFDVTPRDDLARALAELAAERGLICETQSWRRGYAVLAVVRQAKRGASSSSERPR
jgi:S-adenosylmethionine-diacylgycerolhomoserine-N-methlytransferase